MVDPDRLDDLVGGDDDSGGSSKSGSNNTTSSKSKSGGSGGSSDGKKKTKRDKLREFKSNQSSGVSKPGDGGGTEDVKRLLFCLANMDAYTRLVVEKDFGVFNKAQSSIKDEFARDVSGEIVNFLGVFDVRDVCDNYGYSWSNILETSIERNDLLGESMSTNSGNPSDEEIKDLLDCIANVLLFVEGNLREKQETDDQSMRDSTVEAVSENIYDRFTDIISRAEVHNIAERRGYDWKEDVIEDVLANQDFEERVKE